MDKKAVAKKVKKVMDALKPGDVVQFDSKLRLRNLYMLIPYFLIRRHQKKIFKNNRLRPAAKWHDTHTTIYFPGHGIFSVEPPRALYKDTEAYITKGVKDGDRIAIYRYSEMFIRKGEDGKPIMKDLHDIPEYIEVMKKAADKIVGTKYDYGQLLDIMLNRILGYGTKLKFRPFDLGKKRKACSIGCRVIYEALRKFVEVKAYKDGVEPDMTRLFDNPDEDDWTEKEMRKFDRTDVEATTPAHFANSRYFDGEFMRIVRV